MEDAVIGDGKQEKRIKHYSNSQKILLVGEGDFSFSLCLARAFVSAENMVATSLDSKSSLMAKYSKAMSNLKELEDRGCTILHGVNVHTMSLRVNMQFDRIIYNFPHAGFSDEHRKVRMRAHQNLVSAFFKSASEMLTRSGEIHVTHKVSKSYPFINDDWGIVDLAEDVGLWQPVDEELFSLSDYPGYENKRGAGTRCDETFPVGPCYTFIFAKLPPSPLSFPLPSPLPFPSPSPSVSTFWVCICQQLFKCIFCDLS